MVYNPPQGWDQRSTQGWDQRSTSSFTSPPDPRSAPRQKPPAGWPVAVYTALFGMFGALSASKRAAKARALGASTSKYWATFAVLLILNTFVVICLVIPVFIPVYMNYRESAQTKVVESRLLTEARTAATAADAPEPTSVECRGDGPFVDGFRTYQCVAYFADDSAQRVTLLADLDGNWKPPTN
jgi:hypothetical protein